MATGVIEADFRPVDQIISEITAIAVQAMTPEEIVPPELEYKASLIPEPSIGFQEITDLTSLCLFYEDLYHERKDVANHSLIESAAQDLTDRVERLEAFTDFLKVYTKTQEKIETPAQFDKFIEQFNEELTGLERQLGSSFQ